MMMEIGLTFGNSLTILSILVQCIVGVFINEGLYWTSSSNIIYLQNGTTSWIQNNTLPQTGFITVTGGYQKFIGMSYDYRRQFIVFSDKGTKTISLVGIGDRQQQPTAVFLHVGTSSSVGHVTVDWLSGNVYWSDSTFGWIGLQALPKSINNIQYNDKFRVIVDKYLDLPSGVAVHPQKRFLFWSDIGKQAKIERSNLDGSSRMVLVSLGIIRPTTVAVDHTNSAIYWTDAIRGTVESCDFYGQNRIVLLTSYTSQFYGLAVYRDYVLVTDQVRKEIVVYTNKIGNLVPNPVITPDIPYSLAMYSIHTQPYLSGNCNATNCQVICITTLSGAKCLCEEGYALAADGITCDIDIHELDKSYLISNGSAICALSITTINSHMYLPLKPNCINTGTALLTIDFVAVNTKKKELYYTGGVSLNIYRQKLNGTSSVIYNSSNTIKGLSFDWITESLYWTEDRDNVIYRGNVSTDSQRIDNSTMQIYIKNLNSPRSLVIDPLGRRLFWIAGSDTSIIQTTSLDRPQNVITLVGTGLTLPNKLTFSKRMNRLFWTDTGAVGSIVTDGTGLYIKSLPKTYIYTGISTYKDYLMWMSKNASGVFVNVEDRSDPSSTKEQRFLLPNIAETMELQMLDSSLQFDVEEPCVKDNGGCLHICIAEDYGSHCECELGYTLHTDRKTCTAETQKDNFFLVVDELISSLYQISRTTGDIIAVKIDKANDPSTVVYDKESEKFVWLDKARSRLKISNLDGTNETILTTGGISNQSRVAVDPTTGNIYYTTTNFISVITQDGRLQKDLIEGLNGASSIVLHSKIGKMYWTEKGNNALIKQANMDGSFTIAMLEDSSHSIISPTDIAIDTIDNVLIWCDNILDKIERIDLFTHSILVLRSNTKDYPVALSVDGMFVFFIGKGQRSITRIDKLNGKGAEDVVSSPLYGKLSNLFITKDGDESQHHLCSMENGMCSRLCLPRGEEEKTCACPNGVSLRDDGKTCVGDVICPKDIQNGEIQSNCPRYVHRVCEYSCSDGFIINPMYQRITCAANGLWNINSNQLCTRIKCNANVINGKLAEECKRQYEERCEFTCNHGYVLQGIKTTIVCQADGAWDIDVSLLCKGEETGLSSGTIIGIVSASIFISIAVVVAIFVCLIVRVRRKERSDNHNCNHQGIVFMSKHADDKKVSISQESGFSYYSTPEIVVDNDSLYDEIQESTNKEQQTRQPSGDDLDQNNRDRYSNFPGRTSPSYFNPVASNSDGRASPSYLNPTLTRDGSNSPVPDYI